MRGTHVGATGDIGLVRIVSEGAVAAGVRRIEALTGEAARHYLDEQERRLKSVAATLKISPADVPARVEALLEERRKLERELSDARRKLALGGGAGAGGAEADVKDVGGTKFLGKVVEGVAPRDLKSLADDGKKSLGSGVVTFVGVGEDGKASVVVAVTDDLTARFSAVDLVRKASAALGGQGGGGRPTGAGGRPGRLQGRCRAGGGLRGDRRRCLNQSGHSEDRHREPDNRHSGPTGRRKGGHAAAFHSPGLKVAGAALHSSPKSAFHTTAPMAAPTMGATQNSQSWPMAPVCANSATPVERAGLTEVLVTGMETR